ncbi:hypothetical protein K7X08_000188 [Anisodus acutangulus]|uniref:Uncharacterized protein n=1 Tax=Anisodus acutangulus TaxID=402998 RepID=A0A9Q1M3X1_9SOLA|nr:hypothetical protein K7X08_000188 [Anisodus acutangulus]
MNKGESSTKTQDVPKNGAKVNEQAQQRGRQVQTKKGKTAHVRGKSAPAPPKQTYKPTGVIFGIDKPHPTNEVNSQEKEKGKLSEQANMEETVLNKVVSEENQEKLSQQKSQMSRGQPSPSNNVVNAGGGPHQLTKSKDKVQKDQQEQIEGREEIMITDPSALQVALNIEEASYEEANQQWQTPKKIAQRARTSSKDTMEVFKAKNKFDSLNEKSEILKNESQHKGEVSTRNTNIQQEGHLPKMNGLKRQQLKKKKKHQMKNQNKIPLMMKRHKHLEEIIRRLRYFRMHKKTILTSKKYL